MQNNEQTQSSLIKRMRTRLGPGEFPADDRGRMRMVVDSLVLHLHPTKVPVTTIKWTYTWGLGGLSALLVMLLVLTGILLEMNYTPSPDQAYLDILHLRSGVLFGDLIRSLHHWSANLLVITAVLHLLRVFLTGGHRSPRELNWLIGVAMLLLVLGSNFTGYLLPWDQLAYWAITVGTSLLSYIPLVGQFLSRLLLGGPEVGAATLLNFYGLHISVFPILITLLMSFHFWRVRKDGGLTLPRSARATAAPKPERVTTIPNLVRRELVFALAWIAILLIWSALVPAPLEGIADPVTSPNPAKAPWYFLGIQELLLHFHPLIAAVIIPGLVLGGLFLLPFMDLDLESVGVYFRSLRGRWMALLAAGSALLVVPAWLLLDEFLLHWNDWLPGWPALVVDGIIPFAIVILGLVALDEWLARALGASREERLLHLFLFLFAALILLTVVGIYFRGPGMALYWPWDMPVSH
jgi:quinol-cytochrome oxidoreductase complex cytochrome b subunit